jgi:hypothetical protein
MAVILVIAYPKYLCDHVAPRMLSLTPVNFSGWDQISMSELFSRLAVRHNWQQTHLDSISEIRSYKVKNDKGKMLAEETITMKYTAPQTETFTINSGVGSRFIRKHVFQRLINYEARRIWTDKGLDSLITPENYALELIERDELGKSDCLVVHAVPRRKKTDLFDGKIWIDDRDFAVVKITGRLAKSPSFWIKRVDFVRDYVKVGGFWLLSKEEVISDVRMFGRETMTVDYRDYLVNGAKVDLGRDDAAHGE